MGTEASMAPPMSVPQKYTSPLMSSDAIPTNMSVPAHFSLVAKVLSDEKDRRGQYPIKLRRVFKTDSLSNYFSTQKGYYLEDNGDRVVVRIPEEIKNSLKMFYREF